jgi:hypothetical protein
VFAVEDRNGHTCLGLSLLTSWLRRLPICTTFFHAFKRKTSAWLKLVKVF